jgi:hypothetical protein
MSCDELLATLKATCPYGTATTILDIRLKKTNFIEITFIIDEGLLV